MNKRVPQRLKPGVSMSLRRLFAFVEVKTRNGDFASSPSVAPAKLIETHRVSIRSGANQIALI